MNPVTVTIGPLYSKIVGDLEEHIQDVLHEELAYNTEAAQWIDLRKNAEEAVTKGNVAQGWDGVQHFYNKSSQTFRSGFAIRVLNTLSFWNVPYVVDNKVEPFSPRAPVLLRDVDDPEQPLQLRDYQHRVKQAIQDHQRLMIWAVPRSGKTVIIGSSVADLGVPKTIFLCADLSIQEQTVKLYRRIFPPHVQIGWAGDGVVERGEILIITRQTACSAYNKKWKLAKGETEEKELERAEDKKWIRDFFFDAEYVTVDECDEATASQYRFLLRQTVKVKKVVGISGTPWKEDNSDLVLEGNLGPIFPEGCVGYDELIEKGYLVRPEFLVFEMPMGKHILSSYQTIYKRFITENAMQNQLIRLCCDKVVNTNRTCLVLCRYLQHVKILKELMPYAEAATGSDPEKLVKLQGLRDRKFPILISTLFRRGTDIPSLDVVINAEGGESGSQAFQRPRNMTPFGEKRKAVFIEFRRKEKFLRRHSDNRISKYESVKSFVIRRIKVIGLERSDSNGTYSFKFEEVVHGAGAHHRGVVHQ